MIDHLYRLRLTQDLVRWERSGILAPDAVAALRAALGPEPKGPSLAVYLSIAATLLLAGALLAFVASNWDGIDRPLRLAMLVSLIAAAHVAGAWFDRRSKALPANLATFLGSLAFTASVALVGQMYHLARDLSGGFLLCSVGALTAAALTRTTGALAVALVAAIAWSATADHGAQPHWTFLIAWLVAAGVAAACAQASARHLVAAAAVGWLIETYVSFFGQPKLIAASAAIVLLLGAAMLCASFGRNAIAELGETLIIYMSFALAGAAFLGVIDTDYRDIDPESVERGQHAATACGLVALGVAAMFGRLRGLAFAALAAAIMILILGQTVMLKDFRIQGLFALLAVVALVAGGAISARRPVFVAGWVGFAFVVGYLTWFAAPTFLDRALFLAAAGGIAIAAAVGLRRLEAARIAAP